MVVVSMQSSAQEVTMLFKLIAAAKDSWACLFFNSARFGAFFIFMGPFKAIFGVGVKFKHIFGPPNVDYQLWVWKYSFKYRFKNFFGPTYRVSHSLFRKGGQ